MHTNIYRQPKNPRGTARLDEKVTWKITSIKTKPKIREDENPIPYYYIIPPPCMI